LQEAWETKYNTKNTFTTYGDKLKKAIVISVFIDQYNHFMGGIDIANQCHVLYEAYQQTCRSWWPPFTRLLDIVVVNCHIM